MVRIELGYGSASGFIFKTDNNGSAYVMTNYHVIEGAWSVTVWVNDSRQYQGKVLGYDGKRDLAVVEICCGQFKALPFGDSGRVKAGEDVIAIGYPLNISASATVTKGIVSATRYEGYWNAFVIQTDTPINPGNSGGPLLSSDGRVIGINTASNDYSADGSPVDGVGWAIAEQSIQHVALDLQGGKRTGGATATPWPTLTPTPQPIQDQWETYTNRHYKYDIQVPRNWTIDDSDPASVMIESPWKEAFFNVFKPDWRITSPRTELQNWLDELEQGSTEFDVIGWNHQQFERGDITSVRYTIRGKIEYCVEASEQFLIVPSNGWNSTWITMVICRQEFELFYPIMNDILLSFHQR